MIAMRLISTVFEQKTDQMNEPTNTEKTYFSNGKVTVTNTRFIVQAQTYAMSGVTSVKHQKNSPNRLFPLAALIAGFLLVAGAGKGGANIWQYAIFMSPGIVWLAVQRTYYSIQLSSASGEIRALVSKHAGFIKDVADALNQSIIERG